MKLLVSQETNRSNKHPQKEESTFLTFFFAREFYIKQEIIRDFYFNFQ